MNARFSSCIAIGGLLLTLALPRGAVADEPERIDVFVSGEGGYHTYRIPALIVSKEGTLLAFCEGRKTSRRDHGDVDLVLRRSEDGGATWKPMTLVYEEGDTEQITIGNPCPVVDQSTGIIWLPFCRDNDEVLITSSRDDGLTWTAPRVITADVKRPDWGWYATGPGNGIQLTRGPHQGRLVIPCDHRVNDKGDWNEAGRSHIIYSDDHGETWQLGGVTDWGMNECAVVELADGRLMLNMRSYRGLNQRGVATSDDSGLTWSAVAHDSTLIEPVCQASLIRHSWPSNHEPGALVFSNPAAKERHHLTVRISFDEGKTWPTEKLLYPESAAYSSLVALPNGDIGILYERDSYQRLTFSRLPWDGLTSEE